MPKRRRLNVTQKRLILERQGYACPECGEPLEGRAVHYDHEHALWISGDDSLKNIRAIHESPCHREKTKHDVGVIAKIKRVIRKADGTWRPNRRRLQGQGFDKRFRKKMDGSVVERKDPARMA